MVKAIINGINIEVEEGTTIYEAASRLQIKIPVLCHHKDLVPSAACGICVVKVKGMNKLLRSCSTLIDEGMDIVTHDSEIVETRKNVLELILSNHPNECLTCARNNDCELQRLAAEFAIREEYYEKVLPKLEPDATTKSIVLDPKKCVKCGRCVQVCQQTQNVWALSFVERGFASRIAPAADFTLGDSPCVRCGQCAAHCPVGAIYELDETQRVWNALRDEEKYCVVQIAPAVRVAIGEKFGFKVGENLTKKLYSTLRRLGFKAVFDTNFGADLTIIEEATEFVNRFTTGSKPLPLITSCCPAWVDYMEKYYPDMIGHFSSCKSPQAMVGALTKTYYAEKIGVDPSKIFMVSIMPCTAKKFEIVRSEEMYASGYQDVDVSLTTRELTRMINQAGIDFTNVPEAEPDHILADYSGGGLIFGATGGVMEAALRTAYYYVTGQNAKNADFKTTRGLEGIKESVINIEGIDVKIAVAHGLGNVGQVLDKVKEAIKNGEELPYHFIEVMACPGGCIGGGGQPLLVNDDIRQERMAGLYFEDKTKNIRNSHSNSFIKKLYEEFLEKPGSHKCHSLLHTEYKPREDYHL